MTDEELRPLVLEAIKGSKGINQYESLRGFLQQKFVNEKLGPFGSTEHVQIKRILWDLSVERIISWGDETDSDARWPFRIRKRRCDRSLPSAPGRPLCLLGDRRSRDCKFQRDHER